MEASAQGHLRERDLQRTAARHEGTALDKITRIMGTRIVRHTTAIVRTLVMRIPEPRSLEPAMLRSRHPEGEQKQAGDATKEAHGG